MRETTPRMGQWKYAVFVPFSRRFPAERFFDSLAQSDVPFGECYLIVYIDHDDPALIAEVTERALAIPFAQISFHITDTAPPDNRAGTDLRRVRQAQMRRDSADLVPDDAELLLLLEDDTTVPPNSWERLTAMLDAGYDWASGFEVGRWHPQCAGIWRITDMAIDAMMPDYEHPVQDCDATGVYLVMTTPAVYKSRPWDTYDDDWGQDVTVTWLLKQDGYRLGVDWSLECVHMAEERDYLCSEVEPLHRVVGPCQPLHYTQKRIRSKPVKPSTFRMGRDVEFEGVRYRTGQMVHRHIAVAMSEAGVIESYIR